jgi:hypothetical protein
MTGTVFQTHTATRDRKFTPNRHQAHHEIAKKFGLARTFTRSEFNQLFHQEYPERISPPNPSDYCVNLNQKMTRNFPKFLRWIGRSQYEFIGVLIVYTLIPILGPL